MRLLTASALIPMASDALGYGQPPPGRLVGRCLVAARFSTPLSHAGMLHPLETPRRPSQAILAALRSSYRTILAAQAG